MDQGVLVSIKRQYQRKILEELLFEDSDGGSFVYFLRGIHVVYNITYHIPLTLSGFGALNLHDMRKR
jgi:hypothetical protein